MNFRISSKNVSPAAFPTTIQSPRVDRATMPATMAALRACSGSNLYQSFFIGSSRDEFGPRRYWRSLRPNSWYNCSELSLTGLSCESGKLVGDGVFMPQRDPEKARAYHRAYNKAHKQERKVVWRRYAMAAKQDRQASRQVEKLRAFNAYGGPICACCGETHIEFLSIDHIHGGGTRHRRDIGGSARIYRWLRDQDYPPGFRVLCMNCNSALGYHGSCPHGKLNDVPVPTNHYRRDSGQLSLFI